MHGGQTSRKNRSKLAEALCKDTGFTKHECECLLDLYGNITKTKMSRTKFRDFLHDYFNMTDDTMLDRVFRAFNKDTSGFITMEEWVKGLSVFLNNNLSEQIEFCFTAYDLNADGIITREEMFTLLKNSIIKTSSDEDLDEGVKDLVEIAQKILDVKQNKAPFEVFRVAVEKEPLLLQCLGPCLPAASDCEKFREEVFQANASEQYSMMKK